MVKSFISVITLDTKLISCSVISNYCCSLINLEDSNELGNSG